MDYRAPGERQGGLLLAVAMDSGAGPCDGDERL